MYIYIYTVRSPRPWPVRPPWDPGKKSGAGTNNKYTCVYIYIYIMHIFYTPYSILYDTILYDTRAGINNKYTVSFQNFMFLFAA